MDGDIDPLIKATLHEEHVIDGLDSGVPYALGGIRQHAEDQRSYALVLILQFGSEVLHHLDGDAFIRSLSVWIVQAWRVHQRHLSDSALFEAPCD